MSVDAPPSRDGGIAAKIDSRRLLPQKTPDSRQICLFGSKKLEQALVREHLIDDMGER